MLHRTASGPLTAKIGLENMCVSLNQKDKIIYILEKELEGFQSLRENYQRLKDRKNQMFDKCQMLNRQINMMRTNSQARVDQSQKNVMDLKMMVAGLEGDLQNKQYVLKDLKFQAESLLKQSEERQNNLLLSGESIQHIKSSTEILKMQSQRLYCQIAQYKDELDRMRQYHFETDTTRQKIKSQIINTQTFIRQLGYEEGKLTQNLSIIQDQNNSIDEIIGDLGKVAQMTKQKIREVRQEKQDIMIKIKSKQLQKGRTQTEHAQRQKQLKSQREKQRTLKQVSDSKKNEIQRLSKILKEVNEQSEQIMKSNLEVENINIQLQRDLCVCRKHLENVSKNNVNVKEQLEMFFRTNLSAIKKLRKPMDDGWIQLGIGGASGKKELAELDTADGFGGKTG